ncbi:hypothetical protein, partial [Streptomyces sp. Agncl-13]|uniref:hypothetical protein n=1 Tax=Streptomyces sp. Agncl-13 TaxID=3400628 RepID=UPI003A84E51B
MVALVAEFVGVLIALLDTRGELAVDVGAVAVIDPGDDDQPGERDHDGHQQDDRGGDPGAQAARQPGHGPVHGTTAEVIGAGKSTVAQLLPHHRTERDRASVAGVLVGAGVRRVA